MLRTLTALAEPNRFHIVQFLQEGPHSVGEIVDQLKLPQPQVSKHLRILTEAGLVEVQPVAQRRIYQLRAKPFQELDQWLESFRSIWDDRLDRLDEYLLELQGKAKEPDHQE